MLIRFKLELDRKIELLFLVKEAGKWLYKLDTVYHLVQCVIFLCIPIGWPVLLIILCHIYHHVVNRLVGIEWELIIIGITLSCDLV